MSWPATGVRSKAWLVPCSSAPQSGGGGVGDGRYTPYAVEVVWRRSKREARETIGKGVSYPRASDSRSPEECPEWHLLQSRSIEERPHIFSTWSYSLPNGGNRRRASLPADARAGGRESVGRIDGPGRSGEDCSEARRKGRSRVSDTGTRAGSSVCRAREHNRSMRRRRDRDLLQPG